MDLSGRHVLLTGASRGIGAALAEAFAAAGAVLSVVARDIDALTAVAERTGANPIVGDLLDAEFRAGVVEAAEQRGPIDVLVNNAGLATYGSFAEHDPADISRVLSLNVEVPALLTRAVLPAMLDRGMGSIVNVSSVAMAVTTPGFATYGASKSALSALAESLRVELAGSGVTLTTVEIGEADTDMLRSLRSDPDVDAIFSRFEKLRLQRLLDPDEVAAAIVAAVSADRPFVRLPRRAAALPAIVNMPRALANALTR